MQYEYMLSLCVCVSLQKLKFTKLWKIYHLYCTNMKENTEWNLNSYSNLAFSIVSPKNGTKFWECVRWLYKLTVPCFVHLFVGNKFHKIHKEWCTVACKWLCPSVSISVFQPSRLESWPSLPRARGWPFWRIPPPRLSASSRDAPAQRLLGHSRAHR